VLYSNYHFLSCLLLVCFCFANLWVSGSLGMSKSLEGYYQEAGRCAIFKLSLFCLAFCGLFLLCKRWWVSGSLGMSKSLEGYYLAGEPV
jgi:hypothetical protein